MIFFSSRCLEYSFPGHPESPERVRRVYEYLNRKGYRFEEVKPCRKEDILLVHTPAHLKRVKTNSFFDPDTPNMENIYQYASLSAGAALQAAKQALEGENSFSLLRPPGHHAGKNYLGGFCYFNNIAIAVTWSLKKGVDKIAIVDFDGHHGNGSEDIFLGEKRVLYLSLHQYPAYPGTGEISKENCLNFPLPPGCKEEQFMRFFLEGINKVKKFSPSLIAVSAGFDAYKKDPLLNLNLEVETYLKIGEEIASLSKPLFALLEGGYHRDLPLCVENFLKGAGIK
ncbi:histone deacetylase [Candidatus Aerophobetes bacterium]|nr:histone deacetylase [Candidatus Aerophobetes bacterium]